MRAASLDGHVNVTLYGVEWCPWVASAKRWLDIHAVDYELVEVADYQPRRTEVLKASGQYEVPVIVVESSRGRHVFLDETDEELAELLGVAP